MAKNQEFLEVEVIIPENILKENSELQNVYKDGKLTYELNGNLPKELKEELKGILLESKDTEIALLNPAIKVLVELQKFKLLQYNKDNEKESVQEFKDAKKVIGSFNTSITSVKSVLKAPHISYNKKVDAIFNFFKQESDNTKNALENNFDEYLKEQERIKEEKENKKKAEELAAINALTQQNKEQEEKLLNQKRETKKLEIENAINKISANVNSQISSLNLEGLNDLKIQIENFHFDRILSEFDIDEFKFTEEEFITYKQLFLLSKESSERVVDASIKAIEDAEIAKELQAENKVLQAENKVFESNTPNALLNGENDTPFSNPIKESITDLEKLQDVVGHLFVLDECLKEVISHISGITFKDDALTKIRTILLEKSLPQVQEWSTKLVEWTTERTIIYQDFLNSNNQ